MKRILILSILTIAAFANSCNKSFENEINGNSVDFKASIEKTETKVVLSQDGSTVHWEIGDKISVNGNELTASTVSEDKRTATFSGTVGYSSKYNAIFPAAYDDYSLPSTQTYEVGKFNNIPMYASSTTKNLEFKNIFAVLKVSVSPSVNVKTIKISSDLQINGAFTVNNDNTAVMKDGKEANKTTILNCNGVAGTDFFIAIPAGNYQGQNLKVTLVKSDNSEETMTTNQSTVISLSRNTIYCFNFRKDGSMKLSEETITSKDYIL